MKGCCHRLSFATKEQAYKVIVLQCAIYLLLAVILFYAFDSTWDYATKRLSYNERYIFLLQPVGYLVAFILSAITCATLISGNLLALTVAVWITAVFGFLFSCTSLVSGCIVTALGNLYIGLGVIGLSIICGGFICSTNTFLILFCKGQVEELQRKEALGRIRQAMYNSSRTTTGYDYNQRNII